MSRLAQSLLNTFERTIPHIPLNLLWSMLLSVLTFFIILQVISSLLGNHIVNLCFNRAKLLLWSGYPDWIHVSHWLNQDQWFKSLYPRR